VMARLAILATLLMGGLAHADRPALDDSRLGGSAADVRAVVDRAAAGGLPAELLVDKVREGLAKGVPPARIALVVRDLADSLGRARSETQNAGVVAPSAALLKTIVDAHAAGVGTAEVAAVLRSGVQDCERALQVLTDLAQRGYPVSVAARTVAAISARGKNALDHLVGEAERLRSVDAAVPADALDELDHGPNRETSGDRGPRSGGVAAPGRGKNQL